MAGAALKRLMAEYKRKSARKVENFVLILICNSSQFSPPRFKKYDFARKLENLCSLETDHLNV